MVALSYNVNHEELAEFLVITLFQVVKTKDDIIVHEFNALLPTASFTEKTDAS